MYRPPAFLDCLFFNPWHLPPFRSSAPSEAAQPAPAHAQSAPGSIGPASTAYPGKADALLPAYGHLDVAENFERLIDDVCLLVETNPVPWTGVTLNREAIRDRMRSGYTACSRPGGVRIESQKRTRRISGRARAWPISIIPANSKNTASCPRYIHLFRDGRDVALSFKKAIVGEKHSYHLAHQWKKEQDASIALFEKLGPDRVIRVRYEDLLKNPENELKRVCAFIGAGYSDVALSYHQSAESRETASSGSMWQNVVKPVLADNRRKFLAELSETDIRIFERVARRDAG